MMRWMTIIPALFFALGLAAEEPPEIIKDTTDRIIELIEENRETYEADAERMREDVREVLMPRIDTLYSARLVLGRHGRGRDEDEVLEFADALAEQLLRRYASALLEYDLRDRLEILPMSGENTERMTRVRTRIQLDGSSRAPMDYVFRKTDDEWLVFDVIVEGISYVATFRNQIGEEIRRHGFDGLMERLRKGEIELEVEEDNAE
ncbi:ABC transporter substrate-binding protein [Wenzhouxiangella sp. AB-CW3]|uniref:MlaC/ttg2D family ABC transporter substrate-binding protein n=1 Tax=Wenzhouxiangella sp. AB-CW3 TaxID=2771012 RepID=UPI00168BEC99|nr:ABC transporter substrate-binding protein [Wenzhouxiangella sp. AB-CW3]QOC21431.1 ABC transporter substrate-binding protein [Wenzhouxiangella sp. AB-CW3]